MLRNFVVLALFDVIYGRSSSPQGQDAATEDACESESMAVRLLQLRSNRGYTFFKPDPMNLVWDRAQMLPPQGTPILNFRNGWLRVPIAHKALEGNDGASGTPFACLRVRGISSAKRALLEEPAPLGVLLAHCGGPGIGRECNHGIDGKFEIFDYYDHITIDQRGVVNSKPEKVPSDSEPLPPCPFKDAFPYPVIKCNELMTNESRFNEIMAKLKLSPAVAHYTISPIILAGGLPNSMTTGLLQYNNTTGESMLRWWYRLAKLEMELCYANPKYKIKSPAGQEFNAFDHMGTLALAHDINVLSDSLGQRRISCWGVSYGTAVCGSFATTFPDRISRLILDGNTHPKPDVDMYVEEASWGPQAVFRGISAACEHSLTEPLSEDEKCPMAPFMAEKFSRMIRGNDTAAAYIADRAFNMMSTQPDVTCSAAMLSCLGWLQRVADTPEGSKTSGLPTGCPPVVLGLASPLVDNSVDPNEDRFGLAEIFSVVALDVAGRWTEDGLISWWRKAKEDRIVGLSRSLIYGLGLGVWPAIPRPIPPIGSVDVAPLVMGNLRDLQTSYDATQDMRSAFPRGRLLTYQGYGHGMSLLPEDVTASIEASMVSGSLPKTNLASRYACTGIIWNYITKGTLPIDGETCAVATTANVGEKAAEMALAAGPCKESLARR
mmetsp:Transcript_95646/g.270683  ORF Transcript_95646/g.270683 Transcript_95646/m.270683 type:complete len:663 (+) Transcript_95646:90-2078(+)